MGINHNSVWGTIVQYDYILSDITMAIALDPNYYQA